MRFKKAIKSFENSYQLMIFAIIKGRFRLWPKDISSREGYHFGSHLRNEEQFPGPKHPKNLSHNFELAQ